MRKTITWLHISDIHFNAKKEWRDSASRSSLLAYLKSIFDGNDDLRPDLIFCTGDIAFGENSSNSLAGQYEQAKQFFDSLLEICGSNGIPLPKERLFSVPGNHDVNRKNINSDAQTALSTLAGQATKHVEAINQRFDERSIEFKDAIKRLDEYGKFVKDYLPHQHDEDGRHHYAKVIKVHELNIGIAGFNSAWTCSGPEDDRNIWLAANWQFNAALPLLQSANLNIGLMHHPVDWLNSADRDIATRRIASEFDFWLHGHSHNAWVTPIQTHTVVAAGAIGAEDSDEFGINVVCIDLDRPTSVVHLHNKKAGVSGWTIEPIHPQAPAGRWQLDLPKRLKAKLTPVSATYADGEGATRLRSKTQINGDHVDRYLSKRLDDALRAFSSHPKVWVSPILSVQAETAQDAKAAPKVDLLDFIKGPTSTIVKAPPQYGLTCLAHFLIREAWRTQDRSVWIYLDSKNLKPNNPSINRAVADELAIGGFSEADVKCIVLDSWTVHEKDNWKLLRVLSERFKAVRIICMQQADGDLFGQLGQGPHSRQFETLYLWSLSREHIRSIVTTYNDARGIGDEDAITTRLIADLDVLNLHRTALNCLTLLKVSEVDFDESPVNRSEVIKRVLFLLFNIDDIPTYKARPDLKDCEYVLGYFCEILIREGAYFFPRDRFLLEIQKCCQQSLIDLETDIVFDVLYANSIIVKRGNFYSFKFSYWIFYFAAQRMLHSEEFAAFIFKDMRYANFPEIIEFYTGIDRRREDALETLIRDIKACSDSVKAKCGLPSGLNPYRFAQWISSPETEERMQKEIADGVRESNLPAVVKDKYADRHYDQTRPYDQSIKSILTEHSLMCMLQTMKAGARALRNSDYVSPEIKRQLLREIMNCWEQASMVLLVVLPILAAEGRAIYDGTGFVLIGDFGKTPQERALRILGEIPFNVVSWSQDDLFSKKMGPLLFDQLGDRAISDLIRHELTLLLIYQRPRDWHKHVQRYIASTAKNSFYLYDVYRILRGQYRYGFASPQTLREIEHLIKMAATKHVTGDKAPGIKAINKVNFTSEVIPPREVL